ncbi:MAG: TonB family protein [Telluria sp.]
MKNKHRFALYGALIAAAVAVHARNDEVVVQAPPPLAPTYGGGVPIDCQPPAYPREALRYELEGKTTVELLIGVDGQVHGKRIFTSSGWKLLDEAALASLSACRYSPVTRDGRPAGAHWKRMAFMWTLQDHEGKRSSRPVLLRESCVAADRLALIENPLDTSGVLLRFLTSPQGSAFGIKIERGSGTPAIDSDAVKALESCRFTPSQVDGKPGPGNAFAVYKLDAAR